MSHQGKVFLQSLPAKQGVLADCPACEGWGRTWLSCCGNDMNPHEDSPRCPECGEWQGEDSAETCEDCNGTGKVIPPDFQPA